jgi:hypothetical protein
MKHWLAVEPHISATICGALHNLYEACALVNKLRDWIQLRAQNKQYSGHRTDTDLCTPLLKFRWCTPLQVKKLQERIEKLRAENKRYRETNRTAEFEAAAAALQAQVSVHVDRHL